MKASVEEGVDLFREALEYWARCEPVPEEIRKRCEHFTKEEKARIMELVMEEAE